MATTLEQYYQTKQQLLTRFSESQVSPEQAIGYQELMYRISVLESCMAFVKTAPVNADMKAMCYHYQIVDNYFTFMLQERQFGIPADEKVRKQRATALENLTTVITSVRKQFHSYKPTTPEGYKENLGRMINTVLPAWLQYRFTYVPFC